MDEHATTPPTDDHDVDLSRVDTYELAAELIRRGFLKVEMTLDAEQP